MAALLKDGPLIGRIVAAYNLAKGGRSKQLELIHQAYKKESFWGAKREFAAAIAKSGTQKGLEIVCDIIATETDHQELLY